MTQKENLIEGLSDDVSPVPTWIRARETKERSKNKFIKGALIRGCSVDLIQYGLTVVFSPRSNIWHTDKENIMHKSNNFNQIENLSGYPKHTLHKLTNRGRCTLQSTRSVYTWNYRVSRTIHLAPNTMIYNNSEQ